MSVTRHWGEIPSKPEPETVPDVTGDIERSMNKLFLNEFDDLVGESLLKMERIRMPRIDPHISTAISLHKHLNILTDLIKERATNKSQTDDSADVKVPELPHISASLKCSEENIDLSRAVAKQILFKSVATLFAQIGYETSQQSCLDVMTDVVQSFFHKIACSLKTAIDNEETHISQGFPNPIERVLTETGLGGVEGVSDYYQKRVINYVTVLHERCTKLNHEYQALLLPKCVSPVDKINKVVRVKVEEEDVVEVENPEVHFSAIEGDVNLSILETGYQLLNSLEAETNLQSLGEAEDDVTSSTESPGVVPISESDVPHLVHYNKKKRFK